MVLVYHLKVIRLIANDDNENNLNNDNDLSPITEQAPCPIIEYCTSNEEGSLSNWILIEDVSVSGNKDQDCNSF